MTQRIMKIEGGYPEVLLFMTPDKDDTATVTIRCWSEEGECIQHKTTMHHLLARHFIRTFDESAALDFVHLSYKHHE